MSDPAQTLSQAAKEDRLPVFGIVGQTFHIFTGAPLFFLALSTVAALPGLVRLAILGADTQNLSASSWAVLVINMLLTYLLQIAMTFGAARVYEGSAPNFGEALRVSVRRFFPVLGAVILVTLSAMIGTALLIVPGIIVLCMFAVVQPICVLESLGPVNSLTRSRVLTKGSRWRILGLYFVFLVPLIVVNLANSFLLIRAGHATAGLTLNALITVGWSPIVTIFAVVTYLELRRLKEHLGVATVFD